MLLNPRIDDASYSPSSLHYVRNKEKQEADVHQVCHKRRILLVETKSLYTEPAAARLKFQSALKTPSVQLVNRVAVLISCWSRRPDSGWCRLESWRRKWRCGDLSRQRGWGAHRTSR